MLDRDLHLMIIFKAGNLGDAAVCANQTNRHGVTMDLATAVFNLALVMLPHHTRSLTRIIKFIGQRFGIAYTEKSVGQCDAKFALLAQG